MTHAPRGSAGWGAVCAAALALLCVTPANTAASSKVRIKAGLTATSVDPDAQGRAGLWIRGN